MKPMKKAWLLPFLILGIALTACTSAHKGKNKPASSLLWKISGKGLAAPSYIFGTFHIMCKDDFSISPAMENIFLSTKQFYGELKMDDPGIQLQLLAGMRMQNKTLSEMMGEEDFKKASGNFQRITGMPLTLFNQFTPFMPMSLLAINGINCKDNVQPESTFMQIAKTHNFPIHGLESVQDQINAVNGQPLDSQVIALKQTLHNFDSVQQSMQLMLTEYKKNDAEAVYRFIKDNSKEESDFEARMLTNRNMNWIPVITKAITEQTSFFAVGAGHLGGPTGVLALLRKKGYKLTPILY